jgi:EpsI family protein
MLGKPLKVNRVIIKRGDYKQLVWYWFPQRDRIVTDEYLLKWYLFVDGIIKGRTDGSLVRLTTSLRSGEEWVESEQRLRDFARKAVPILEDYLPK